VNLTVYSISKTTISRKPISEAVVAAIEELPDHYRKNAGMSLEVADVSSYA
jgi:hypothetical protein